MQGILNVLKPPGMTSHDVVTYIRRLLREKRVGHTGTLDPPAAGVLVLLVGKGTRLNQFLTGLDKTYRGEITFGIVTDTQDATGKVIERRPAVLSPQQVAVAFARFTGSLEQVPPMVSAVKHQGKRLYQWAREGKTIVRSPRKVEIKALNLLEFYPEKGGYPRAFFECHCSKGTYIRTLAADIGDYLGCGAHLSFLLRTRVGPFGVEDAVLLEELQQCPDITRYFLPLTAALRDLPQVIVKPEAVRAVSHGNRLYPAGVDIVPYPVAPGQLVRLEQPPGRLLALATWEEGSGGGYFHPRKVFHG